MANTRPAKSDVERAFGRVFSRLERIWRAFHRDGVLLAAVVGGEMVGYVHLPLGRGASAVVGRHRACDLVVPAPELELRHVVVAAFSQGAHGTRHGFRVFVWDLETGSGFRTERGERCDAVAAEGPLFLRVGAVHLMMFPTGSLCQIPWAATAEETWGSFPERVYFDQRVPARAVATGFPGAPPAAPPSDEGTLVTSIIDRARPLRARRDLGPDDGIPAAAIRLTMADRAIEHVVTDRDLERGILVGRWEACAFGGEDAALSRIHLLIVRVQDGVWAIDTASSNGTYQGEARVRSVRLRREREVLRLGGEVTVSVRNTQLPPELDGV